MTPTLEDVRTYYDRNTPLFLRFGSSPETRTIHRSLWLEGTRSLKDALAVSNDLILDQVCLLGQSREVIRLADLGCGVGATLFHILAGLGGRDFGIGITLSNIQAHLAEAARKNLGMSNIRFIQGDFHSVPLPGGDFDLVYSIEAFIHAQKPDRYLAEASRLLHPGGRLVLLDDFYTAAESQAREWLEVYQKGWYVPKIQTREETIACARDLGLILLESRDLTPFLRLRALPDTLARAFLWMGKRIPGDHPIVPSMLGSMALQQCLKAGWIEYRWFVFQKN